MASIRERAQKDGSTTYAVLFRQGKRQTSMTFTGRKEAEGFRAVHTGLSLFLLATAVSTITNLAVHQPLTPGYYFTVAAALVAAPILLRAVWSDLHSDTDTKER